MAMQIKTENALSEFVADTQELFSKESDPEKRWSLLSPILSRLLGDPEVVAASTRWPECIVKEGRAENLIFYEDPGFGFVVNGLVKDNARREYERTGQPVRLHDHAHLYTLYGVLDGHERVERAVRVDDRSKPDYAEIEMTSSAEVGPGEIDLVKPYEIHREVTVGERTVAIIVRSQKGGTFNQGRYEPSTGRYWESLGPRQTPWEMFKKR